MRANTQRIFELLSKGSFLSVDTTEQEARHLYNDIEENFADYESYFLELGLRLESGDGYYILLAPVRQRLLSSRSYRVLPNGWILWIS